MAFLVKDILSILLLVASCNSLPNEYLKFRPFFTFDSLNQLQANSTEKQRENVEIIFNETTEDNTRYRTSHAIPGVAVNIFKPHKRSLQIVYEPIKSTNDSKLKFTDSFLQNIIQSFKRSSTTEKSKKTTKQIENKLPPIDNKPRPRPNTKLSSKREQSEEVMETSTNHLLTPVHASFLNNSLSGQSQIGNRESQMVIKPTVIVNIRGTVTNTDSDIKVESRYQKDNDVLNNNKPESAVKNIYLINQEVNVQKDSSSLSESAANTTLDNVDYKTFIDSTKGRSSGIDIDTVTYDKNGDESSNISIIEYIDLDFF